MPPILADTNRVALRYIKEAQWGVTPANPTMQAMRFTGHTLNHNKSQVESAEIRNDRQVADVIQTGATVEGAVNIEMSQTTHEDFILAALGTAAWTSVKMPAQTLAVTSQANGLTSVSTTASPIGAGVIVGAWLWIQDSDVNANIPAPFKVSAVDATHITFEDPGATLTNFAGPTAISGKYAFNGVAKTSFTIEEQFTDLVNAFVVFNGLRVDQWQLTLNAQKIIDGSFSFYGQQGKIGTATLATAVTGQTTTSSISASADVGALLLNNAPQTAGITKVQFTLKNNLRHRPVVGSKFDDDHGYGKCNVTCSITALVPDLTMFAASINHTDFALDIPMVDEAGNGTVIVIPRFKVTGNPAVGAENQDVTIDLNGMAKRDPASNSTVQVYAYTTAV